MTESLHLIAVWIQISDVTFLHLFWIQIVDVLSTTGVQLNESGT